MKDEGGRMNVWVSNIRFSFILHPSAFIPAFLALSEMINNNKKLPQTLPLRCFVSESANYERKRESFDGLNAQYD